MIRNEIAECGTIVSALITPFDKNDRLNVTALREVVQHNLSMGVRAFYACGTTGESFSLSVAERRTIVETVRDESAGKAALIVNVSHMEYRVALALAEHATVSGADAISLLPPLFFALQPHEITRYYLTLMDKFDLPVTIYNIPALAKIALDEKTVRELALHPNFLGVKHTSEDNYLLNQFKKIDEGRLLVWSGRDAYYLGALAMGADGAIGSSFNLMGDLFLALTSAFRRGDVSAARSIQEAANEVHRRLMLHGPVQSIKRCFTLLGIDAGDCRLPFQPLNFVADDHLRAALDELATLRCRVQEELVSVLGG